MNGAISTGPQGDPRRGPRLRDQGKGKGNVRTPAKKRLKNSLKKQAGLYNTRSIFKEKILKFYEAPEAARPKGPHKRR